MAAEPVRASVFVEASPERVYQYFTEPTSIVRWLGEYALLEPRPTGRFHLDVRGTAVRGQFLELEPPRRLLISWGFAGSEHFPPGASTVEVRLIDEGNGTRVELEHRGLPDSQVPTHASGWRRYLARLTSVASQRRRHRSSSPRRTGADSSRSRAR
jgi:uncharacterized protein YndB with AHSA1/START domain